MLYNEAQQIFALKIRFTKWNWSRIYQSCIFRSCIFLPWKFGPSFSSRVGRSVIQSVPIGPSLSGPEFSVDSQLAQDDDETLFERIKYNKHHVLQQFLPDHNSHSYSLRPRCHDFILPTKKQTNVTLQLDSCSLTFINPFFKFVFLYFLDTFLFACLYFLDVLSYVLTYWIIKHWLTDSVIPATQPGLIH